MNAEGQAKMTTMVGPVSGELQQEAAVTRRVLERVPGDRLAWKPHSKSMSLGQLAMHVATIPGNIAKLAQVDEFDASNAKFEPPTPKDSAELLAAFEASIQDAREYLAGLSDSAAAANWRMTMKGKEVFNLPRIAMLRAIMLNHWYHHRGQLSVYLRLLDVPVPSIYGPSADENPFV
jgi:uncharacterized damage-inducible protein DinB